MQPLRAVAPIDMDKVTMEDLKKSRSIWYVDDEDEEWGTGYDESMCPASQRARLTMKKGRQFIVDVSPTDTLASLQPKALEFGAALDDEIVDLKFMSDEVHLPMA